MNTVSLQRIEGWESRLAKVIVCARMRPYRLGEHDCTSFACAAVAALTGVDLWPRLRGRYATRLQSSQMLVQYGGSFASAIRSWLGLETQPMKLSRRGDLSVIAALSREHLAVVIGTKIATPGLDGLIFVDRARGEHCWQIG